MAVLPHVPARVGVDLSGHLRANVFIVPNTATSPPLLLCKGNDCFKKNRRAFDALKRTADRAGLKVEMVKCQGACSGPTAVVIGGDGPRWFEDLTGTKVQLDVCELAASTADAPKPSKRLRSRELTGKARSKAAKRLAKQR